MVRVHAYLPLHLLEILGMAWGVGQSCHAVAVKDLHRRHGCHLRRADRRCEVSTAQVGRVALPPSFPIAVPTPLMPVLTPKPFGAC